jgi:hypothetical protein
VSQTITYNLLTEKWIPILYKDGKSAELSILETLQDAAKISMINDPIPTFRVGIYRMLVAFIMDVFRITNLAILNDMLSSRTSFDMEKIRVYAKKYEPNFDLFDKNVPFYQVRAKAKKADPASKDSTGEVGEKKKKKPAKIETKTVAYLFQFMESGTNRNYFTNKTDKDHAICPPAAARAICSIPAFMTMRGVGYSPSLNGAPPIYIFVLGENLFQTLLLNSCVLCEIQDHMNDPEVGMPVWRSPIPIEKMQIDKVSVLLGLTYQPRSIRLIPSEGGICTFTGNQSSILIREMEFGPAWKWVGKWIDPNVAYVTKEKKKSPIRLRDGRDIWRDFGPLMFLHESKSEIVANPDNSSISQDDSSSEPDSKGDATKETDLQDDAGKESSKGKGKKKSSKGTPKKGGPSSLFDRPAVVRQLSELDFIQKQKGTAEVGFEVCGMMTEKAKIFKWQCEILSLPLELTLNPDLSKRIQSAIAAADDTGFALKIALKDLLNPITNSRSQVTEKDTTLKQALGQYWQSLKGEFESCIIDEFSHVSEGNAQAIDKITDDWMALIKNKALQILSKTADKFDTTAHSLKNGADAVNTFYKIMYFKFNSKSGENGKVGNGKIKDETAPEGIKENSPSDLSTNPEISTTKAVSKGKTEKSESKRSTKRSK